MLNFVYRDRVRLGVRSLVFCTTYAQQKILTCARYLAFSVLLSCGCLRVAGLRPTGPYGIRKRPFVAKRRGGSLGHLPLIFFWGPKRSECSQESEHSSRSLSDKFVPLGSGSGTFGTPGTPMTDEAKVRCDIGPAATRHNFFSSPSHPGLVGRGQGTPLMQACARKGIDFFLVLLYCKLGTCAFLWLAQDVGR